MGLSGPQSCPVVTLVLGGDQDLGSKMSGDEEEESSVGGGKVKNVEGGDL